MPKAVNRYQVREMLAARGQLIEVLPQEEYHRRHLPGAVNVPLKDFNPEFLDQFDKDRPVIVYCADTQ
jgi:rhodanese-related sulfurtransferase